jgi:hypothetical protein
VYTSQEHPVVIADVFHAQLFRLQQNVPQRAHSYDKNYGNQDVIHSHYGADTRVVKYTERSYAVTNSHVPFMEDDIQNFVQHLLSWILVFFLNWQSRLTGVILSFACH